MKTSDNGIALIKRHEGVKLQAYLCPAGVWTIGYGHTKGVKQGDRITQGQADLFLRSDLYDAEYAINRQGLTLNQNQFDALVSFVFNVGSGNFEKSTLLKLLKANVNDSDIYYQFNRWIYGKNKMPLAGLIKRRGEEAKLYFTHTGG